MDSRDVLSDLKETLELLSEVGTAQQFSPVIDLPPPTQHACYTCVQARCSVDAEAALITAVNNDLAKILGQLRLR